MSILPPENPARFGMLLILVSATVTANEAHGWHINTIASDPCHEQLTLGALGASTGHWAQAPQERGARLLEALEERMEPHGVPDHHTTRRWIDRELAREGLDGETSTKRRYVLASFIAGVRAPDLEGHHPSSLLDLMDLRNMKLVDERQPEHTLRRSTDAPGEEGDRTALEATRSWLERQVEEVGKIWNQDGLPTKEVRWVVQGYKEQHVHAFAPAYLLGRTVHGLQDSYSHAIRDQDFRVITVLNFIDAIKPDHDSERDGLPHSYRLDECNVKDSEFDRMRFAEAQEATYQFLAAALASFTDVDFDSSTIDDVLDEVLDYRSGCNSGDYCGTPWLEFAREGAAGPYSWANCYQTDDVASEGALPILVFMGLWRWMRGRRRAPMR